MKRANCNGPWAYVWEGLLSEGFLRVRFRGPYCREGLLSEFYGFLIYFEFDTQLIN